MSRGPTETSHWVDDEKRLLASAYPGDRDEAKHVAKIKQLRAAGITHVVSLQPQDEADRCRPYAPHLPTSVVYQRFPIVDRASAPSSEALWELAGRIETLLQNKTNRVMVHCLGGHGRTGLVVSVYLARRHGLSADAAIRMNDRLHAARESQGATQHATLTAPQRRQAIALCHAKATARAVAKKPVAARSPSAPSSSASSPAPVDKAASSTSSLSSSSSSSSSSLSSAASPSPKTTHRRIPIATPRARVLTPAVHPTPAVAASRPPAILPPPLLYTSLAAPPISSSTSTAVWPLALFATSPRSFAAASTSTSPLLTPSASVAPLIAPAAAAAASSSSSSRPPPSSSAPASSASPIGPLPRRLLLPSDSSQKKKTPVAGGGGDGGGDEKNDCLLFYGHRGRVGSVGPHVLSQFWQAPFLGDCVRTVKLLLQRSSSSAEQMPTAVRSAIAFRSACLADGDGGDDTNRNGSSKRRRSTADGGGDGGDAKQSDTDAERGDSGGGSGGDDVRRKKSRTSGTAQIPDDANADGDKCNDARDAADASAQSGPTTTTVEFACAEQWMMASKAIVFGDRPAYEAIMRERQPAAIKRLGRKVKSFDAALWDRLRVAVVECGNWLKFSQNPALGAYLRSISATHIGEASPRDRVWGIGLDATTASRVPSSEWPGENLLGRVLEHTRAKLRRAEQRKKSSARSAAVASSSQAPVAP